MLKGRDLIVDGINFGPKCARDRVATISSFFLQFQKFTDLLEVETGRLRFFDERNKCHAPLRVLTIAGGGPAYCRYQILFFVEPECLPINAGRFRDFGGTEK